MEKYYKDPVRPVIGQGTYGVVYRVRDVRNGQEYALKCHKQADVIEDATVRELSCLTALKGHPNIIQLLDCFMDEDRVAMLMPHVPFELTKAIHRQPPAPLSFVASFSLQTANALEHMHGLNILHRDLVPSNVLLEEDLTVKVGDMGLARQYSRRMSLCVVTEPYRAPGLFVRGNAAEYTCAIDMWSLGAMILDAKEGAVVFAATRGSSTLSKVMALAASDPDGGAEESTPARQELIPNTMKCEHTKRIAFRLIALRHDKRLTARQLLDDEEWKRLSHMTDGEKAEVLQQCVTSVM
ncbi:cyclin-dependent kinase 2 homolog [Oryzias latipes]